MFFDKGVFLTKMIKILLQGYANITKQEEIVGAFG